MAVRFDGKTKSGLIRVLVVRVRRLGALQNGAQVGERPLERARSRLNLGRFNGALPLAWHEHAAPRFGCSQSCPISVLSLMRHGVADASAPILKS